MMDQLTQMAPDLRVVTELGHRDSPRRAVLLVERGGRRLVAKVAVTGRSGPRDVDSVRREHWALTRLNGRAGTARPVHLFDSKHLVVAIEEHFAAVSVLDVARRAHPLLKPTTAESPPGAYVDLARAVARAAASRLRQLHDLGEWHGDLTPANMVIVDVNGDGVDMRLVDLENAKQPHGRGRDQPPAGTPGFCPADQPKDPSWGYSRDLYGLIALVEFLICPLPGVTTAARVGDGSRAHWYAEALELEVDSVCRLRSSMAAVGRSGLDPLQAGGVTVANAEEFLMNGLTPRGSR